MLRQFIDDLDAGSPYAFVKMGDGEMQAMTWHFWRALYGRRGWRNCDGHHYSRGLQMAMLEAFRFLAPHPRVWLGKWAWGCDELREQLVGDLHPQWAPFNLLVPGEGGVDPLLLELYEAIRRCPRPKLLVAPERLSGVKRLLRIEQHLIVPLRNAYNHYPRIHREALEMLPENGVAILACGFVAKLLAAGLMQERRAVTCLDFGSGFDALLVGRTRLGQPEPETLREQLRSLL